MKIEELFVAPDVIYESLAETDTAKQTTKLCRSNLDRDCYFIEQETCEGETITTKAVVYFTAESLKDFVKEISSSFH